ncbi:chlorophyllase-1 [Ziziphus jujuba]|uniref:Chlorophyllase-1 n=1 Tax=Ziziphus jujuba TaxID=326968 RepID=A0A6P4ACN2_ZIZJJ|nr:chlorophyllase-1 [Ziziphus jujuba]
MALLEAKPASSTTTTSVFDVGNFKITCFTVETTSNTSSSSSTTGTGIGTSTSPPKPLFIVTPTIKGTYPILLFLHGFYLRNTFYSQLLQHISSHGYILVAPQLYELYKLPTSGTEEIDTATKVTEWLLDPQGLQPLLPENVEANLKALALVGHSRGGKAAFSLAINDNAQQTSARKYSVLVGIDPVAGLGKCCQTEPKILTYEPQSFNISIPITVIGTGLGPEKANLVFPPCAPEGVNHKEFFNECKPPCGYFVTKDYGHMDVLDDDPSGFIGKLSGCLCKNGKGSRDPMRRTVGGIVVAFIRAYLQGDKVDLIAIVDDPDLAPAKLDPVEFIKA